MVDGRQARGWPRLTVEWDVRRLIEFLHVLLLHRRASSVQADCDVSSNSCTFTIFLKFKRSAQELTVLDTLPD
jgi:hypothetical protein